MSQKQLFNAVWLVILQMGMVAMNSGEIIRIFNGCEVRTENSVTRVTVRHREACLVMPNNYPE